MKRAGDFQAVVGAENLTNELLLSCIETDNTSSVHTFSRPSGGPMFKSSLVYIWTKQLEPGGELFSDTAPTERRVFLLPAGAVTTGIEESTKYIGLALEAMLSMKAKIPFCITTASTGLMIDPSPDDKEQQAFVTDGSPYQDRLEDAVEVLACSMLSANGKAHTQVFVTTRAKNTSSGPVYFGAKFNISQVHPLTTSLWRNYAERALKRRDNAEVVAEMTQLYTEAAQYATRQVPLDHRGWIGPLT